MNEIAALFLDSILAENVVFVSLWGILLLFLETEGLRKSLTKGLKITSALMISLFLGWLLSSVVGEQLQFILLVCWISSLVGILFLSRLDLLQGTWLNMPRFILALAPFTGIQWLVLEQATTAYFDTIYLILGTGAGFYLAFILTAAVREQLKISELPENLKREPLLMITMGFFALALLGFGFL